MKEIYGSGMGVKNVHQLVSHVKISIQKMFDELRPKLTNFNDIQSELKETGCHDCVN